MLNICLKKVKKIELRGRICTVVTTERFERMDKILKLLIIITITFYINSDMTDFLISFKLFNV